MTPDHQQQKRILFADDDPLIREMVTLRLDAAGYAFNTAEDGAEALEAANAREFDLLITDLDMPRMTGYELIANVRQTPALADLPIIVATGSDRPDACARALSAGATAFMTKPINWDLFEYQIRYALQNAEREADLRTARVEAEHAARRQRDLLSIIGHELRTPLHGITGFAGLLRDQVHGPIGAEEYSGYAVEITTACAHLNKMVSDALLFSQLSGGDHEFVPQPIDIMELTHAVIRDCHDEALEAGITLSDGDADGVSFQGDLNLLRRSLAHLVSNAIRHAPDQSTVTLEVMHTENSVSFGVHDQGEGIEDGQTQHLVEALAQGDGGLNRTSAGIGMGLAISKAVADQHGGTLQFRRPESGGFTVTLSLPCKDDRETAAERAA